jgi:alkanesulfonate monooxygenase SsuD/methylene tetrahydromethanopterin reductase-like flavin-dependent oxidoreductase (luciferase family)
MKFGVLLPHYGEHTSRRRIVESSRLIEQLGFDVIWVRDHLLWTPHGMEGTNNTFVDAFVTLGAVAGATERIELGTGVVIPIRWPLKVAQNFASLSFVADRHIHAGFGAGANPLEFAGAGFSVDDREQIYAETVEICKRVWAEDDVDHAGELFRFENVSINPKPVTTPTLWYGGSTKISVRRAAAHCDGWLPGRVPLATLDDRLERVRKAADERGRPIITGTIPLWCVEEDREKAFAQVDVDAIAHSSEGAKNWIMPPSGEFKTVQDLEGLIVAGDPDDCVEQIRKFEERGLEHLVVDLRLQFADFEEKLELIAKHVLPQFRPVAATA